MVKNHKLKDMRLTEDTDNLLTEASEKIGLKKTELARFLLNKSLKKLKADSIQAGGYDNLEITIRDN